MMKKLFTITIISLLITTCKKDTSSATPFDEICEINFTIDGKNYSKVLEKNEINTTGGFGIPDAQGNYNQT